ncbi:MAG TPA: hypothetical protein VFE07_13255 [Marmoricola sp.]|nr:hypothetical protein [Marmoricola sp.]
MSKSSAVVCGPSSDDLKANVANFMDRADTVVSHPLAEKQSTISITVTQDPETGLLVPTDFNMNNLPEEEWLYLALKMRPIIFLDDDPISIKNLTTQIEREHVPLRGRLKDARSGLAAWRKHAFVYAVKVGEVGVPMPSGQPQVERVEIGPACASPSGVSFSELSSDYEYAQVYLNGSAWHSDTEKAKAYQDASDHMKGHYRKCAEIRVMSAATHIIRPLRQWILDARADGHDL